MLDEEHFLADLGKNPELDYTATNQPIQQPEQQTQVKEANPEPATAMVEETPASSAKKSSGFYLILAASGFVLVGSVLALILYRKKKQSEFTLASKDSEESEPDYQDYLNKKKKKELVLN